MPTPFQCGGFTQERYSLIIVLKFSTEAAELLSIRISPDAETVTLRLRGDIQKRVIKHNRVQVSGSYANTYWKSRMALKRSA